MSTVFIVWPCALLMVIANANCKGIWHFCRVNGHFKRFDVVMMHDMLIIFLACAPPMICVTIHLRAGRQKIRWAPLQSPEVALRFLNNITRMLTLRARQCGGITTRVMALKNSVPIAIAWSSPISTESANKNTCSRPGTTLAIWVLKKFTIIYIFY